MSSPKTSSFTTAINVILHAKNLVLLLDIQRIWKKFEMEFLLCAELIR